MTSPIITDLVATSGSAFAHARGHLAYLRFTVDERLVVDGAQLRRAHGSGRLYVAWPARRDACGIERFHVRPTAMARAEIEAAVLAALANPVTP